MPHSRFRFQRVPHQRSPSDVYQLAKPFCPPVGKNNNNDDNNSNKNSLWVCVEEMLTFALPSAMLPPVFLLQILRDALEG